MTKNDLIKKLNNHRDNDVRIKIHRKLDSLNIKGVNYDSPSDSIEIITETPYHVAVIEDLIPVLRRMDARARRHKIGDMKSYNQDIERISRIIGCSIDEIREPNET